MVWRHLPPGFSRSRVVALVAAWTGRHGSTVNPVSGRLDVDVGCCRGFGPCLLVSPRGGGGAVENGVTGDGD